MMRLCATGDNSSGRRPYMLTLLVAVPSGASAYGRMWREVVLAWFRTAVTFQFVGQLKRTENIITCNVRKIERLV